jgi:hypothetical protein
MAPRSSTVTHTRHMERVPRWFGTPVRAASTLIWLCWVSLLASLFALVGFLLFLAVRFVVT